MKIDVNIDACKQGEQEALGDLYKAYSNKLRGICQHYVKDESTAEDILHDAFIIIFTSIKTLKDNSKLEGWMITIVRNLSLRYLQSTGKDNISLSSLEETEFLRTDSEETKHIDIELLLSAIESLPEGSKEIFKLSVLDGLSHKEIGELLGINPHSSSSQLFRAKKLLREILSNYWALLLLPILTPIYIYFIKRYYSTKTPYGIATAIDSRKNQTHIQKEPKTAKTEQAESSKSSNNKEDKNTLPARAFAPHKNSLSQIKTDSISSEKTTLPFCVDSLHKYLAKSVTIKDTLYRIPQIPANKTMALNRNTNLNINHKKKSPWTFNFGFSSNTGANGSMSNLGYLSVVDYANNGATTRLYTWDDLENYLTRNSALMDSIERAKMSWIVQNNKTSGKASLGEKVHHYRPKTFSISLSKQLSSRWTFGTGITYTKLKSDFESEYNKAKLVKTQKIDYLGIPLRLTYRIWNKGRFCAYTTGGVTFEMPVNSSLDKKYIVTADSSFTLKEGIKPRYQWSANLGIGVQYKIFKPFSLYLEPNMFYYFRNGSGIETYRTEHPFFITVPFGLRLTW